VGRDPGASANTDGLDSMVPSQLDEVIDLLFGRRPRLSGADPAIVVEVHAAPRQDDRTGPDALRLRPEPARLVRKGAAVLRERRLCLDALENRTNGAGWSLRPSLSCKVSTAS